jgi:hypothetical protein
MKPLQHAQISQKKHGGKWQDYIEVHNFLDSSKMSCAHFKHRFFLHHEEGIELGVKIFGQNLVNSEGKAVATRQLLTEHLIEDVGRTVTVEDWAQDLLPKTNGSFYQSLAKKRNQIENDEMLGEKELFDAFNLSEKDRAAVKDFLLLPLKNSAHPAALLVSHNSLAIFLAEQILGVSFVKDSGSKKQLISVREIFERLIFLRLKSIHSPAEIIARTAFADWMRGAKVNHSKTEKKR